MDTAAAGTSRESQSDTGRRADREDGLPTETETETATEAPADDRRDPSRASSPTVAESSHDPLGSAGNQYGAEQPAGSTAPASSTAPAAPAAPTAPAAPAAPGESTAPAGSSPREQDGAPEEHALVKEASLFHRRWESVQVSFVDDPRQAVSDAESLVREVLSDLTAGFRQQRQDLESVWNRGQEASTEHLRVTLQRYRDFFERLLRV